MFRIKIFTFGCVRIKNSVFCVACICILFLIFSLFNFIYFIVFFLNCHFSNNNLLMECKCLLNNIGYSIADNTECFWILVSPYTNFFKCSIVLFVLAVYRVALLPGVHAKRNTAIGITSCCISLKI